MLLGRRKIISASFQSSAPMQGLIYKMKYIWGNDLIDKNLIRTNQSGIYPGFQPASYLFNQSETRGWAHCDNNNVYFDVEFVDFYIQIEGYGIMAYGGDDDAPRSWNLICLDDNTVISVKTKDTSLCPNAKLYTICGTYDKAKFETSVTKECKKIRFLLTGLSAANQNCASFSGFEFFGSFSVSYLVCKTKQGKTFFFHIFHFLVALSCY
jgi:hypothetical protein